jgi:WD40 repeat protein
VSFNNDGTLLVSSSLDQTLRIWNVAEGKQVGAEIKGHGGIVDSVAWSPDGKMLASGSADKSVRLWNAADGKEIKNLGAHLGTVHAVAWSPDGKLLASASAEPAAKAPGSEMLVKIWDVAAQKELKSLKGHEIAATGVAFSPDSTQLYSIGFDRHLRVWDVASGNEVKKLGPTADDLYGIAVSKDGKTVATSGYGGNLTLWNIAEGKAILTKKIKFGAYCVVFAPDGKSLITGHDDHNIYLTPLLPTP